MSRDISITKILVPVDGSKPSDRAIEYAVDMAKRRKANLVAVHVMHLPAYALTHTPIEGMPTHMVTSISVTISVGERKIAENYLNKVKKMAKRGKVKIETKIIEDQPSIVHAITKIAEKEGCDLIVIGTKGRTGIKRFLLGSVASGVVTYAPCPVLVIR